MSPLGTSLSSTEVILISLLSGDDGNQDLGKEMKLFSS